MISGKRVHREVQRRGPEKTEVGENLIFQESEVLFFSPSVPIYFLIPILSRSGLCSVLWRPGSDSDTTCWSGTEPTQESIILPVCHCHQGGET